MDAVAKNMYVLACPTSSRRSRLLLQSPVTSGMGAVSLAGYIRNSRGVSLTQMRTYGKYALVYLLEGSGRMRSGKQGMVPCRAGDLLFLYPEIPHGYGPRPQESWSEIYVVFSGIVFDLWRQQGLFNPDRPLQHLSRITYWLPRLEAVADPRLPETSEGMLQRVCRLQQFLSDIKERASLPNHPIPWLEQAMYHLLKTPNASLPAIAPYPRPLLRDLSQGIRPPYRLFASALPHRAAYRPSSRPDD